MAEQGSVSLLGKLSAQRFLAEYWQKKPLLIRDAIPDYHAPLSPNELAGLSCGDDVESRIVLEKHGAVPWELRHGPFDEQSFAHLPASHWTLLVQECNKHLPELALLLDNFAFIPGWRIDDVMVSYAAPQGSVGPHVDQYDVFLLQGLGQRRWQIGAVTTDDLPDHEQMAFLPDTELRILKQFHARQEWILNPGDMLYLPPGVAHHGVALSECMTLSIGFRAPNHYELLTAFADDRFSGVSDAFRIPRYRDPDLEVQAHCGQISESALQRVTEIIQSYCSDPQTIQRWFGQFITEAKHDGEHSAPAARYTLSMLRSRCKTQDYIWRSEDAKYAFMVASPDTTFLYVNGTEYKLEQDEQAFAALLCDRRRIDSQALLAFFKDNPLGELIVGLFNDGFLYFDSEDENFQ